MNQPDCKLIIRIYICFISYYLISVFIIQKFIYKFILWNLFLAMIPLGFAFLLQLSLINKPKLRFWDFILGSLWFVFFPNAPYLITDLIHINAMPFYEVGISSIGIEYWVSLLHIGGGVIFGIFAGMHSLMIIHKMILNKAGVIVGNIMLVCICMLTGYGVYIGRFIRLNSWDILNPLYVLNTLIAQISFRGSILSLLFAVFTLICYILFYMFLNTKKS